MSCRDVRAERSAKKGSMISEIPRLLTRVPTPRVRLTFLTIFFG